LAYNSDQDTIDLAQWSNDKKIVLIGWLSPLVGIFTLATLVHMLQGRKALIASAPLLLCNRWSDFPNFAVLDFSYQPLTVYVMKMSKLTKIEISVKKIRAKDIIKIQHLWLNISASRGPI
jgi:hypothetical protein